MKKLALFIPILSLCFASVGQTLTKVSPEKVSFKATGKVFSIYPNSTIVSWYKRQVGVEELTAASIKHEGKSMMVTLNKDENKVITEEIDRLKDISVSITYNLDLNYEKYKIKSFTQVTDYKTKEVFYSLQLKTKDGDQTLFYDDNMLPLELSGLTSFYMDLVNK